MPDLKPDDSLEPSMRSRSLGIALGVTELLFIAGIALLASGLWLEYGLGVCLWVSGAVVIAAAFFNSADDWFKR